MSDNRKRVHPRSEEFIAGSLTVLEIAYLKETLYKIATDKEYRAEYGDDLSALIMLGKRFLPQFKPVAFEMSNEDLLEKAQIARHEALEERFENMLAEMAALKAYVKAND